MPLRATVAAATTNLWSSPTAPRAVDSAMLAGEPDLVGWLRTLDAAEDPEQGRLGLDGRLLTQLVRGEPVEVVEVVEVKRRAGGEPGSAWPQRWARVRCPWQPSSLDAGGYPGWLPAAHLGEWQEVEGESVGAEGAVEPPGGSSTPSAAQGGALLAAARGYLAVPYLWGGCCDAAVDCSGLVHRSARGLGLVVPRDADDQYDACSPVPVDLAEPGDLYFFARPGARPHHVAVVSGPGRMLHAPQAGVAVVEEELDAGRRDTLVGAGRLPTLHP